MEVPEILKGLPLYEKDEKLCTKILFSITAWMKAYPLVDIKSQIAWAHSWEMSNPSRQKKDRIRFLNNWMASNQERREADRRTMDQRRVTPLPSPIHYEETVKEDDVMSGDDFRKMREEIQRKKIQKRMANAEGLEKA